MGVRASFSRLGLFRPALLCLYLDPKLERRPAGCCAGFGGWRIQRVKSLFKTRFKESLTDFRALGRNGGLMPELHRTVCHNKSCKFVIGMRRERGNHSHPLQSPLRR